MMVRALSLLAVITAVVAYHLQPSWLDSIVRATL
jgi:hypothetical protein